MGYRTPIVVNHEKGCRLSQKATRWVMRLCFVYDQTTAVWAFWCCGCVAVADGGGLVALVWCVCICGVARLNNFRLGFPVGWADRKLLGFQVHKSLTGNSKAEIRNFRPRKKRSFGCLLLFTHIEHHCAHLRQPLILLVVSWTRGSNENIMRHTHRHTNPFPPI